MSRSFTSKVFALLVFSFGPAAFAAGLLNIPTLIKPGLMTHQEVCADAAKRSPGKRYALVLLKSHACDGRSNVCLRETRDAADPCNLFMGNFAVYHTRIAGQKISGTKLPYKKNYPNAVTDEWSREIEEPGVIV